MQVWIEGSPMKTDLLVKAASSVGHQKSQIWKILAENFVEGHKIFFVWISAYGKE